MIASVLHTIGSPRLTQRLRLLRQGAALAVVAGTLALTGCQEYAPSHSGPSTQGELNFPIHVEVKTFAVEVASNEVATASTDLLPDDFVVDYIRRGHGPMVIVIPEHAVNKTYTAGKKIAHWLGERTVHVVAVQSGGGAGVPVPTGPDRVVVFYRAPTALVKSCGDWSGENGSDPTNLAPSNYGCAIQNNTANMVSNPDDLVVAQPADSTVDATRAAATIDKYRSSVTDPNTKISVNTGG